MGALAAYIMRGKMQAIMTACFLSLLSIQFPPISIVSSAMIALVTLRLGAKEGGYVLMFACLAAGGLGLILMGNYQFTLFYSLFLWTPVWVIAVILREGRHLFLAIEIVVSLAILAILAAYVYQPHLGDAWQLKLSEFIEPLVIKSNPDLPEDVMQASLSVFFHYILTGLMAQIYILGLLAGLFLGRAWQAILYNPGGFKREYIGLRGQKNLAFITLITLGVAWFSSGVTAEICWNIMVIFFVLYAFLGTVVLHCTFSIMKRKQILIPFLYVSIVLIPHALVPAAIIGLLDTWLNLRKTTLNQLDA
ncbi:MAG: hypothetical protein Q9M50_08750 [Methylococcales bacterium]|nr:hypothetical protein [Methylococcales bacterium]